MHVAGPLQAPALSRAPHIYRITYVTKNRDRLVLACVRGFWKVFSVGTVCVDAIPLTAGVSGVPVGNSWQHVQWRAMFCVCNVLFFGAFVCVCVCVCVGSCLHSSGAAPRGLPAGALELLTPLLLHPEMRLVLRSAAMMNRCT